jgi:hypothetical protein
VAEDPKSQDPADLPVDQSDDEITAPMPAVTDEAIAAAAPARITAPAAARPSGEFDLPAEPPPPAATTAPAAERPDAFEPLDGRDPLGSDPFGVGFDLPADPTQLPPGIERAPRPERPAGARPSGEYGMPAIDGPDGDITTSPTQRAVTSFDLGASDARLKLPETAPSPWKDPPLAEGATESQTIQLTEIVPPEKPEAEDRPPKLVHPVYLSQPAVKAPEKDLSRRRFVLRGGLAVVAVGAGLHAFGRRPVAPGQGDPKPATFGERAFRTLIAAFETILESPEAARRAALQTDLQYGRLGQMASWTFADDLFKLEFVPGGPFEGRRFSRMDREQRRAVLDRWRGSRMVSRRRTQATLERLARYFWVAHGLRGLVEGG